MNKAREQKYVFLMLKAVLTNSKLSVEDNLDWDYIYKLCKFHRIDNIIVYLTNN